MGHRSFGRSVGCAASAADKIKKARLDERAAKREWDDALAEKSLPMSTPSAQVLRNRQEEIIWQGLREPRVPKTKDSADLWRPGSPAIEALALFRLVGNNGDTVESLRELICVNDRELTELQ